MILFKIWQSMDIKSKIGFIVSVLSFTILVYVFTDEYTRSALDDVFSKYYIAIPLTTVIAFLISHYFHKKSKPVQKFWEEKRRDTIYDVCTCINQIQICLRSIEKQIVELSQTPVAVIEFSFNVEINKLRKYIILYNQYLTNIEVRQLEYILERFQNYLNGLIRPEQYTEQQKEDDIITLESVIYRLVINFKTVPANQAEKLLKPISVYFNTAETISSRNRRQHSEPSN